VLNCDFLFTFKSRLKTHLFLLLSFNCITARYKFCIIIIIVIIIRYSVRPCQFLSPTRRSFAVTGPAACNSLSLKLRRLFLQSQLSSNTSKLNCFFSLSTFMIFFYKFVYLFPRTLLQGVDGGSLPQPLYVLYSARCTDTLIEKLSVLFHGRKVKKTAKA